MRFNNRNVPVIIVRSRLATTTRGRVVKHVIIARSFAMELQSKYSRGDIEIQDILHKINVVVKLYTPSTRITQDLAWEQRRRMAGDISGLCSKSLLKTSASPQVRRWKRQGKKRDGQRKPLAGIQEILRPGSFRKVQFCFLSDFLGGTRRPGGGIFLYSSRTPGRLFWPLGITACGSGPAQAKIL